MSHHYVCIKIPKITDLPLKLHVIVDTLNILFVYD